MQKYEKKALCRPNSRRLVAAFAALSLNKGFLTMFLIFR
jgi:hypothetical protein